jgi:hypothetical protein
MFNSQCEKRRVRSTGYGCLNSINLLRYELKFNKLWDCFEDVHMKLVRDNAMITGECNALRQQLLEATDVPFIRAPNEKKAKK